MYISCTLAESKGRHPLSFAKLMAETFTKADRTNFGAMLDSLSSTFPALPMVSCPQKGERTHFRSARRYDLEANHPTRVSGQKWLLQSKVDKNGISKSHKLATAANSFGEKNRVSLGWQKLFSRPQTHVRKRSGRNLLPSTLPASTTKSWQRWPPPQ